MQKEQEEAEAAAAAAAQAEKDKEEEAAENWEEMDVDAVKLPGKHSADDEVCSLPFCHEANSHHGLSNKMIC